MCRQSCFCTPGSAFLGLFRNLDWINGGLANKLHRGEKIINWCSQAASSERDHMPGKKEDSPSTLAQALVNSRLTQKRRGASQRWPLENSSQLE